MKKIVALSCTLLLLFPLITFGKTVKASSFGFDAKDATSCLQKAFSSGARKVIIDYTGKDYLVHKTISLRSNQHIILEDKVVIRAAKGAFKKARAMFTREGGENITIEGKGNALIVMNKKDYRNPKLYTQSEHRHIFSLIGVINVTIRNLTLADSGGDGIYFGGYLKWRPYCKNILVENVRFKGHNRLGLAVISGENVIIRNCSFDNAVGAPPQGGIDFEPNKPNERLINCLVENCTFTNNKGAALSVAPTKLNFNSKPVSVTIRNCRFSKNGMDLYLQNHHDPKNTGHISVKGKVNIENCVMTGMTQLLTPSIYVRYDFKNCTFVANAQGNVFDFRGTCGGDVPVGNVGFANCTIKMPKTGKLDKLVRFYYAGKSLMSEKMGGVFTLEQNGKKSKLDLGPVFQKEGKRWEKLNKYICATLDTKLLKIPAKDAPRQKNEGVYFRGGKFLQYAEKGQKINLRMKTRKSGYDSFIGYRLVSPAGKVLEKGSVAPDKIKMISFKAEETGLYELYTSSFNILDISSSHRGSGWAMTRNCFPLIYASGFVYFVVPGNLEEFSLGLNFHKGLVRLRDGGHKIVKVIKDGKFTIHTFKRKKTAKDEIYALEMRNMQWQTDIYFYKPLRPVVSTNKATLFR